MDNMFSNFFGRNKPKENTSVDKPASTLYEGVSSSSKRLMGLKEFKQASAEELRILFPSSNRFDAYSSIETTTFPTKHKIEFKKGIVREIVGNNLIPESVLKDNPAIYLGSGTDVEYPLSLGCREIYMIDPIFKDRLFVQEVKSRIEKITHQSVLDNNQSFEFLFDFGRSPENVQVVLVAEVYGVESINLPKNIGLVIEFASQGPEGKVILGEDIRKNFAQESYVLEESRLTQFQGTQDETRQLGF